MTLSHFENARFNRVGRIIMASMAMAAVFALTYSNVDVKETVASKMSLLFKSNALPGEGALIQQSGHSAVYQIYGGKRRQIPNQKTFDNLYTRRCHIQHIPSNTLNAIPEGPPFTNAARLIQCGNYPHIYLQTNGQKLWICNPSTFEQYAFAAHKVTKLSMAQCYRICNGPILCNNLAAAVRRPFYSQLNAMGPLCSRNPLRGELVKCGGQKIYQFLEGQLRWIPNPTVFRRLFGPNGGAKVLTYPPGYCAMCKKNGKGIGRPFSRNARLIKCGSYSNVYFLVTNGQKRRICDMQTYRYFNFQTKMKLISLQRCKKMCVGETICLSRRRQYNNRVLKGLGKLCSKNDVDWNVGDAEMGSDQSEVDAFETAN